MPYPNAHYLFTFGGPFGSVEQWSVGLRFAGAALADQAEEVAALASMTTALQTAWGQVSNPVGNGAVLAWTKYNRIGVDGKYVNSYTNVKDFAATLSPTAGVSYPNQVALVATLKTAAARGLATTGRIFLPSPKYSLQGPDKTLSAANALEAATWVSGLIQALNSITTVGTCYVMSGVREGAQRAVRRVEVGSALDTMRSRRGKILEARSGFDVPGVVAGTDF